MNARSPTNTFTAAARLLGELALFAVAYYLAYRYGMSFSHATASPFWFPDSVLLSALLVTRPRRWWIFVLAPLPIRLFAEVAHGIPTWFLLTTYAIDSAKGLVTAGALRRFIKDPVRIATVKESALYALFAVLLVPAASAFAGAAARQALGYDYGSAWEQWFLGNALAHLVITPALLYWVFGHPRLRVRSERRWIEGSLLTTGLLLTSWLAFGKGQGPLDLANPLSFAPTPFLFWAAIRFGMPGASGAVAAITYFSVSAALHGIGPFTGGSPAETARVLQGFLVLRAPTLYLFAILIHQMKEADLEIQRLGVELAHVTRVTTMGELTASLAHELRQPLGAIMNNAAAAEIYLEAVPPALDEVRDILADIREDDRRAAEILRRMRSLLEKREVVRQPLEINGMVAEAFQLVRIEALERKVSIEFAPTLDLPLVSGDRVHLQQVVMNLVLNGLEAMSAVPKDRRRLVVRTGRGDDGTVRVAVSDTGPGVAAEAMPALFTPFFTTKSNGLGMGLSITRTIVEAHEGRVWAENGTGAGVTFYVALPAFAETS